MATVSETIALGIIARQGRYEDDPPVLQVVTYTDMGGAAAWAVLYDQDVVNDRYRETEFVHNPVPVWAAPVETSRSRLVNNEGFPVKYGDVVLGLKVIGSVLTDTGFDLVRVQPGGWVAPERGASLIAVSASSLDLNWVPA